MIEKVSTSGEMETDLKASKKWGKGWEM